MNNHYAILPCNGLDKCAGGVTRETAIILAEKTESEIICPVFYRVADVRYNELAQKNPLLVIDGCVTRCASKLAAEKGLKIAGRLNISDLAKEEGITLGTNLRLSPEALALAGTATAKLLASFEAAPETAEGGQRGQRDEAAAFFPPQLSYETFQKDKFIFRLPAGEGFYFNENDVWAFVSGNRARVGVTDYVQKSLSDILFFKPPSVGTEIPQFGEMGEIESAKAVFEIVSPVSGVITAVNEKLADAPEMLNQNPYEQGWIAEMELADFEEDRSLLYTFDGYLPIMKRKVEEFHV